MAAGQGFKTFTTGEVLTAGDVNGYLMQGVLVFASTAARDAAITAPSEGQFAFTKDTNSLFYYDGAAWVASGAAGDIEGVTAGVGISGGGTSGTVTVTNSMATAIDAKGDLVPGTGADTFSRLAVGANDTVLTADSTAATGLKWAAVAGGGSNWSLLNSGGTALTGADTITVSGISGKNKIMVIIDSASAGASSYYQWRFNADSGATVYRYATGGNIAFPTTYATSQLSAAYNEGDSVYFANSSTNGASAMSAGLMIDGANAAGVKAFYSHSGATAAGGNGAAAYQISGVYTGSSTISSVSIISSSGNFDAGKIYVYATA
jgi:hypothetical protein